ncbi:hypothetical protein [Phytoactinopolyspora mesophila]|uniref:Chromosome partitioning protein n=1 Tax=Phytoactinopolyspora mesophila TaxID=2650750 RepID=A0A7K3M148_9ACTN|nr:hypothetical protein [Phytoactinopolyspora mesophila]NDL57023.1 hypothetical protein [Phytoactinopolyspora mesophila]
MTSTRGAPGVTTLALALTLAWPRPALLVEGDVSGSSSINAGHLRGEAEPAPNMVDLAIAARNNALNLATLRGVTRELPLDSDRLVLPGLANSAQRATLTKDFWEALAALLVTLPSHGIDVVIDAGRVGMREAPKALVDRATLSAVVTRSKLDHIVSLAANAAELRGDADVANDRVGAIVVGEGQPHSSKDVGRATGLPVWATVAWDPVNADRLSGGKEITSRTRFEKSPLMRSVRSAISELNRVAQRREYVLNGRGGRP